MTSTVAGVELFAEWLVPYGVDTWSYDSIRSELFKRLGNEGEDKVNILFDDLISARCRDGNIPAVVSLFGLRNYLKDVRKVHFEN